MGGHGSGRRAGKGTKRGGCNARGRTTATNNQRAHGPRGRGRGAVAHSSNALPFVQEQLQNEEDGWMEEESGNVAGDNAIDQDRETNEADVVIEAESTTAQDSSNVSQHCVVDLPEGAVKMNVFVQMKWPKWRTVFWKDWHITPADGKVFAQCKHCCTNGKYHHASQLAYSNFLRHSRSCTKQEVETFFENETGSESASRPSQKNMDDFIGKTFISGDRQKTLEYLLGEMFISDNLPLTLVRRKGFQNFIKVLD